MDIEKLTPGELIHLLNKWTRAHKDRTCLFVVSGEIGCKCGFLIGNSCRKLVGSIATCINDVEAMRDLLMASNIEAEKRSKCEETDSNKQAN